MAKKNSTFLKKLVWNIFVLWVVMTNCVLTVEPKAMSTLAAGSTTSWYRMTTKAFSSLFNTITGGRASTSTDDGGDDVQGVYVCCLQIYCIGLQSSSAKLSFLSLKRL